MESKLYFFTTEQGNLLIRLVVAYLLSEFVLQSTATLENNKWFSKEMFVHTVILFLLTMLFMNNWMLAGVVSIVHYLIDSLKIGLNKNIPGQPLKIFTGIQLLHIVSLVSIWSFFYKTYGNLISMIQNFFVSYKISLIILGYLIVTMPVGSLIKYALQNIPQISGTSTIPHARREKGGKTIGIFERIIILTFVLLNQYEAIGFLITGKSIIRFANQDEHIRSEYVLVGTMMSYGISILVGVLINYLLAL